MGEETGRRGRNIESKESGFADIETVSFVSAVGANKFVCQTPLLLARQHKCENKVDIVR